MKSFGQGDSDTSLRNPDKWENKSTTRPVFEPFYSVYTLNNKINSKNYSLMHPFTNNLQSFGLNMNATGDGDVGFFGAIWTKEVTCTYNYFLPIEISVSDTLKYKFTGFNASVNYGKDLIYSNKTLDIIPSYGYGYSQFAIRKTYLNENKKYINPAFIVNLLLELRLNLIKLKKKEYRLLSLGVKAGYQFGFSNKFWRYHHKIDNTIPKYSHTGSFFQGFISLNLGLFDK